MGSSPSKAAGLGRPGEASLPKIEANQGTRQGEAGSRQTNIREGSRVRFEWMSVNKLTEAPNANQHPRSCGSREAAFIWLRRLSKLFPNLNPLPPWCRVFLWRRWSNRIETYNRGSRAWCSWTLSTWLFLLKPVFVLCVLWCCPELCIKHPLNPTPLSVGFTVRGRKRHMHTDTHRAPPPRQLVLSLCTNTLCMKERTLCTTLWYTELGLELQRWVRCPSCFRIPWGSRHVNRRGLAIPSWVSCLQMRGLAGEEACNLLSLCSLFAERIL